MRRVASTLADQLEPWAAEIMLRSYNEAQAQQGRQGGVLR